MWGRRRRVQALILILLAPAALGQFGFEEEEEEYKGRFIASFNSYHHQVSGKVYAVDSNKLLIKDFVYDGNGKASGRALAQSIRNVRTCLKFAHFPGHFLLGWRQHPAGSPGLHRAQRGRKDQRPQEV